MFNHITLEYLLRFWAEVCDTLLRTDLLCALSYYQTVDMLGQNENICMDWVTISYQIASIRGNIYTRKRCTNSC